MNMNWFNFLLCGSLVICAIMTVGLIAWLIYEAYIAIRNHFLRYEEGYKWVKVGKKQYQDANTIYIPMTISTGKTTTTTLTPIFQDEEFNVYLIYKGNEYGFNNKDLFDSLKVGDEVEVIVHEGYNRKGELKHTYLTIVE